MKVLLYLFDFHKDIESEYKFSVENTVSRNSEQIIFMTLVIYNHTYNLFLKNNSFVLPLHISCILSQSWVICFQVTYLVNKKVKKNSKSLHRDGCLLQTVISIQINKYSALKSGPLKFVIPRGWTLLTLVICWVCFRSSGPISILLIQEMI